MGSATMKVFGHFYSSVHATVLATANILNSTASGKRDTYCIKSDPLGSLYTNGIWYEEDLLSKVMPLTMLQLILFFFFSAAFHYMLRPLKQPKFVCNALAGITLGPSVLGRNKAYAAKFYSRKQLLLMNTISGIGIMYYVFLVAVKTDTAMILKLSSKVRRISISSLVAPFLAIVILTVILRPLLLDVPQGHVLLLIATNISVTGFLNLAPMLNELNLLTTDLAQVAMPAAILNDSILWFLWVVNMVSRQKNFRVSIIAVMFICGLLSFVVLIARPTMKWIIRRTPEGESAKDAYILAVLLGVLVMGFLSDILSASAVIGSLMLGLVTPDGPPLGSTLTEKVEVFVNCCFLPFFFIATGANFDVSSISELAPAVTFQFIILVGNLAKLLGAMLPALLYRMSFRRAFTLGLMMNMKGVVEIAMYRNLILRKIISVPLFTVLTLSCVMTTAIVGPLTKIFYKEPINSDHEFIRSHRFTIQATLLKSELRILSYIHKENNVPGIIWFLKALNPTKTGPICLYVTHVMELVGRAAPVMIHHQKHSRKCKHNGCIHIMRAFENYILCSEGRVTIQPYTMIAPFRNIHEGICRLAQDKRVSFIIVPFLAKDQDSDGQCSFLAKLNSKIQGYAPCTVGILVDRAINTHQGGCENFCYHVVVVFLGGEDDREVLAYAALMSRNPCVSITLVRIFVEKECTGGKKEIEMDNASVDEFRMKNINNERAMYREIRVNDWDQAIRVIISLDGSYDLIMVGQQQYGENRLLDQAIVVWSENPELGTIGDMLVSSDFHGGTVSVLVMRHCSNIDTNMLDISMHIEDEKI
ncbi:hypothetical protein Nepgr_017264 [Nepenthes gracilis]|uniref:Cation/H+ exchanger domain-containing protein n=1 Tax=Nepenthes gracilis TaxID=150966 RepID=A0AAD3SP41_NEPGR|nr:hypothetical protein Nepgr_017264 [Nepenthes gracilis]